MIINDSCQLPFPLRVGPVLFSFGLYVLEIHESGSTCKASKHGANRRKMQLFMPGHMTVFRRTPEVAREFLKLEEVSSFDKFMTMEWIIRPASDGCGERPYPTMALYGR